MELSVFIKNIIEILLNKSITLYRFFSMINKDKSRNIVIISLHKIGDTIFTIPAIKLIYDTFNKKDIFLVAFPESTELYRIFFAESTIVALERENFKFGGRLASRKARKFLSKLKPKMLIDLTGSIVTLTLLFNSKASKIVGTNKRFYKALYSEFVTERKEPHLMDRYLDIVKQVIPIKNQVVNYEFPSSINGSTILIHPFAGWSAKEWNINKYIELAARLNKEFEVEIVSPEGLLPIDIISEINILKIPVSFTNSITALINKIKHCSIFVSNDSGPLYIAAMLGKPTFTIYGPTNPLFSIPFGDNHSHIQKMIKCSPIINMQYCFTNAGRFGCPSFECLNLLEVDEVYGKLRFFISKLGIKKIITV